MPNQLLTDTINTTARLLDSDFETAIDQDILLADYDQAVFKIVKTCVEHTITQKYINGNKLMLEGFFRISVYYQPPQGANLTVISKKQPFNKQLDLHSAVDTPYFITVDGALQYANTRAVNPTRMAVSGVYSFSVRVYGRNCVQVATAVNSATVCTDEEEICCFSLCGRGTRQFSMEDEISLPQELDKILTISANNSDMTVLVYQDKVNIKGDVKTDILYTMADSGEIQRYTKNFAYNQVVDISGVSENNLAYADFSVVNFTVTQNPDTHKINCILTAHLDVKAFRREKVCTVLDAFSKSFEYEKETRAVLCDENIQQITRTAHFTLEDTVLPGCRAVHSFVSFSAPVASQAEDGTLSTKMTVSTIVYSRQNEFECFSKTEDVTFTTGTDIQPQDEIIVTISPVDSSVIVSDDRLKAAVTADISGFVIKHRQIDILTAFTENTDAPATHSTNALVLYYRQKGERLFDIAGRYKTDADMIKAENNIDGKILQEDKMLFIPAFGM